MTAIAGIREANATLDDEHGIDRVRGDRERDAGAAARRPDPGRAGEFALREFGDGNRGRGGRSARRVPTGSIRARGAPSCPRSSCRWPTPLDVFGWMGNQALLVVRGGGDVAQLTPSLRAVVNARLRIPLYDVRTIEDRFRTDSRPQRVPW